MAADVSLVWFFSCRARPACAKRQSCFKRAARLEFLIPACARDCCKPSVFFASPACGRSSRPAVRSGLLRSHRRCQSKADFHVRSEMLRLRASFQWQRSVVRKYTAAPQVFSHFFYAVSYLELVHFVQRTIVSVRNVSCCIDFFPF